MIGALPTINFMSFEMSTECEMWLWQPKENRKQDTDLPVNREQNSIYR